MTDRHLEAVTLSVANDGAFLLPSLIRGAYEDGATVGQVLLAVDVGRCLITEPSCCPSAGWAAAHEWAWISRRTHPPRPTFHHH